MKPAPSGSHKTLPVGVTRRTQWESQDAPSGSHKTHPVGVTRRTQWESQDAPSGSHKTHPVGVTRRSQWESQDAPSGSHKTLPVGVTRRSQWESQDAPSIPFKGGAMALILAFVLLSVLKNALPQDLSDRVPRRGDSPDPTPPPLPNPTPPPNEGCEKVVDCPIRLYFTIDTSETISLQESPPGVLVENIKEFTKEFVQRLADEEYRGGQVRITWSIGGLHFSQSHVVFSQFSTRESFIRSLSSIRYLGKGTYTDCALSNMTSEMTLHSSGQKAVLFSVVITDGHVTGSPCGGVKTCAEKAREQGIKIFSVAASRAVDEAGMREIANHPVEVYRDDYIAVEVEDGRPRIMTDTMDRIIKVMKHQAYVEGEFGLTGDRGKTGRIGTPGCKGDGGDKGPDGFSGESGDSGSPGHAGDKVCTREIRAEQGDQEPPDQRDQRDQRGEEEPMDQRGHKEQVDLTENGGSEDLREAEASQGKTDLRGQRETKAYRDRVGSRALRGALDAMATKEETDSTTRDHEDPRATGEIRAGRGPGGAEENVDQREHRETQEGWGTSARRGHSVGQGAEDPEGKLDWISESVGLANFTLEKHFVINTINRMGSMASDPTSPTGTRVGVVQYSHNGTFEAVLLDDPGIDSMGAFKDAVANLQWIAGGTFTPSALKFAYDHLIRDGRRAGARVNVVVITDGRFDPRDDDTLLPYLCSEGGGVEVNAIGVGDMFGQVEDDEILSSIACHRKDRVMGMRRFADLVAEDFIDRMETVLCPDPVTVCPDLPCRSEPDVALCAMRPVDVVFLLDGSERLGEDNFGRVRSFLQQVAGTLTLARSKTDRMRARLALLQYGGSAEHHVAFGLTHNPALIAKGVARMPYLETASSVAPAIRHAIDAVLSSGGARQRRRNAEVSFVFLTDGVTDSRDLDQALTAMRGAQVVSTVIATGGDTDQDILVRLAMGDREAVFKPTDLNDSGFFQRFIQWIC
ncbi:hypothetical protein NHX12_006955 [Muraenolepis orangiensis]|uniref:VWFA domain-containing protein n=1 Tax=Muraenolepis orangiensis TaxID=630683 RepID=A0A9Q0IBH9_9TELE|nr:hypothetical protein NHX12_006955 [Muraenolepis orangiensis]